MNMYRGILGRASLTPDFKDFMKTVQRKEKYFKIQDPPPPRGPKATPLNVYSSINSVLWCTYSLNPGCVTSIKEITQYNKFTEMETFRDFFEECNFGLKYSLKERLV